MSLFQGKLILRKHIWDKTSVLNTEVSLFQGCPLRGVPLHVVALLDILQATLNSLTWAVNKFSLLLMRVRVCTIIDLWCRQNTSVFLKFRLSPVVLKFYLVDDHSCGSQQCAGVADITFGSD